MDIRVYSKLLSFNFFFKIGLLRMDLIFPNVFINLPLPLMNNIIENEKDVIKNENDKFEPKMEKKFIYANT